MEERRRLREQIIQLRGGAGRDEFLKLSASEQEAMDGVMQAYHIIMDDWKLKPNGSN